LYPSDHRLRDPDGLFCSQAGAGVFSAGAGKSTDIGSRGDADATIAACTKLIYETPLGASQAAAYITRGLAYETEKDHDRAIADYSEAIQLLSWPVDHGGGTAAADDPDASIKKGHVCEVNFFSGELALQRGDKNEAMRLQHECDNFEW